MAARRSPGSSYSQVLQNPLRLQSLPRAGRGLHAVVLLHLAGAVVSCNYFSPWKDTCELTHTSTTVAHYGASIGYRILVVNRVKAAASTRHSLHSMLEFSSWAVDCLLQLYSCRSACGQGRHQDDTVPEDMHDHCVFQKTNKSKFHRVIAILALSVLAHPQVSVELQRTAKAHGVRAGSCEIVRHPSVQPYRWWQNN